MPVSLAKGGAVAAALLLITAAGALAEEVSPAEVQLGQSLYAGNCASCHGANLQGQPDWKRRLATGRMPAPPHDVTGHTWHHSDRDLFNLTKMGVAAVMGDGYASTMSAFGEKLSDDDIKAVLDYIKSTWPPFAQRSQAEITAADQAAQP